jgi:hypothetical protein
MITGVRGFVGRRNVERRTWIGTLYDVSTLYAPRGPWIAYWGALTAAGWPAAGSAISGDAGSPVAAANMMFRR